MRTDETTTPPWRRSTGPGRRRRLAARLGAVAVAGGIAGGAGVALRAAPASAGGATGWVRFAHFSASNGPVAVTLDGTSLDRDVTFETVTPYRSVPVGSHTLVLRDLDAPFTTLRDTVTVGGGGAVTVGAIVGDHGVRLTSWTDDLAVGPAGDARVRIVDTAPAVSTASVTFRRDAPETASDADFVSGSVPAGAASSATAKLSVSAPPVAYGTASPYEDIAAGTYTVKVSGPGGRQLITGKGWPVTAGTVDSVVVVQDASTATLVVLRDAAGSSATPVGGMQTGFGGEAAALDGHHGAGVPLALELAALAALLAAGVGAVVVIRRPTGRGRRVVVGGALGAALALTASACAGAGTPSAARPAPSGSSAHAGSASGTSAAAGSAAAGPGAAGPGAVPEPVIGHGTTVNLATATGGSALAPTSLRIPSIGVDTSLVKLGRTADGAAQVPTTTKVAGWYEDGPAPGQPGPAVILGHVDSYTGPGVFFRLHDLRAGAMMHVVEDGRTLTFEVRQVETFAKATFPTAEVFGPTPEAALRLVTCGGPFDTATRHYVDNVVVFATEVGSSAPTG
jgi:hypothetical protein